MMSKLEEMLRYVSEHNDFYKNRIKEYGIKDPLDITQWPILTRKELQENRYNMFSDGYKAKYYNQQLRRQASSGSSGVPVSVYWDYKDWYASNMSLWRKRLQWHGISPSDRCVMFTLNNIDVSQKIGVGLGYKQSDNILNINFSGIQNNDSFIELIDLLESFAPKWLYIQPYVLKRILKKYQKEGRTFPMTIRYIECVGEILEDNFKREAHRFCSVPIINMYGSEEMNGIGYECKYHNMHILTDNVYVEIKNQDNIYRSGSGEAIITNLNNKAMPLIRYSQGDNITIDSLVKGQICSCSSSLPRISQIKGRCFETIALNEKDEINSLMLLEIMAEVMNEYPNVIIEYRYVFCKSDNELKCILQLEKSKQGWYLNIKKTIEDAFKRKIPVLDGIILRVLRSDLNEANSNKKRILEVVE